MFEDIVGRKRLGGKDKGVMKQKTHHHEHFIWMCERKIESFVHLPTQIDQCSDSDQHQISSEISVNFFFFNQLEYFINL